MALCAAHCQDKKTKVYLRPFGMTFPKVPKAVQWSLKCLVWKQRALEAALQVLGALWLQPSNPQWLQEGKGEGKPKITESNSNLISTCSDLGEISRGTLTCRDGSPWHLSVTESLSAGNSPVHPPLLRTLSDVPAGDKQLWQGQQLIPGPHFPQGSPPFLPPTVMCMGPGTEAALGTILDLLWIVPAAPAEAQGCGRQDHALGQHLSKRFHSPSTPWMDTWCPAPWLLCPHNPSTHSKCSPAALLRAWGQTLGQDMAQAMDGYQQVGIAFQEMQFWGL